MSRKLKKMLLCLLLIAALCVVYELWLAPYLAVLNGEPVQDSTQAEVSEVPGITVQARGDAGNGGTEGKEAAEPQISVTQKELGMDDNKITYFEIDIQVSDATDLKAALAHDKYGQNISDTMSDIAGEHNAALAVLYRDGTMDTVRENTTSGQALLDAGAWNVLSFGPVLVEDGKAREGLKEAYKVDGLNVSISGPEPRTAIGYLGPNHFLILVVDGRQTGYSRGMDFEELAKVFVEHGCTLAYNLDGGGSVTLYQDGEIVNSPCPLVGKERNISDILYVEAGEQ